MDNRPAPAALAIFVEGTQADDARRLAFCNRLISLADLDDYPRRADFIRAYSTGGSDAARRIEARFLAHSGLIDAAWVARCARLADEPLPSAPGHDPEIR